MVGLGDLFPSDSFYVQDLRILEKVYKEWTETLPHVQAYYAVKCNPDPEFIRVLADLGSNFDCASRAEIEAVLEAGVDPSRILFANPCKKSQDIAWAFETGVTRSTFDSTCELHKVARSAPGSDLLLRIRADDPKARCALGTKYGAEEEDWDLLLLTCRSLGLNVTGVSFHVGSFASSPEVFQEALAKAERAVDLARAHGFNPHVIDLGGGFSSAFALPKVSSDLELIAEPGRFFAERVSTLYTLVQGTKGRSLTISESLYGAFNCILFDHARPEIKEVLGPEGRHVLGALVPWTIFGSTCDGGDIIGKEVLLPEETQEGDWIVWKNMGAYTSAACTRFNGIPFDQRKKVYIW
jgi:ornithine decarboxylase